MSGAVQPRARLLVAGLPCTVVIGLELEQTSLRRAGTFRAVLALDLSDPGVAFLLADGSGSTGPIPITVELALADPIILGWITMFEGSAEDIEHDVGAGVIVISGRDATSALIDLVVTDQFVNQTASEIATTLAGRAGLAADVVPTTTFSGQYYQVDHARNALSSFSRFSNAWEIVCALADHEGYDCWVSAGTLNFVPLATGTGQSVTLDVAALTAGVANPLGVTRLRLERRFSLDARVGVTVRSWNSRQKSLVEKTVSAPGGDSATMVFVIPNATDDVALQRALALYRDVARHGRAIAGDMTGELALSPRDLLTVSGSAGGGWDGTYVVDVVTRRLDAQVGFEQSFVARPLVSA